MKHLKEFRDFLNENSSWVYDKILRDEDLMLFMSYLVHDKSHVMDNRSAVPKLEKVFKLVKGLKCNRPLYRGLYTEKLEDFVVGEVYQFQRYQSFSEKLEVAKKFSEKNLILQATTSVNGFNYGEYTVRSFKALQEEDPEEYYDMDGDFMVEGAIEEAEWLFPRNSQFLVESIAPSGKYTIISGRIV